MHYNFAQEVPTWTFNFSFGLLVLELPDVFLDLLHDPLVELLPVAKEEHDLEQDEQRGRKNSLELNPKEISRFVHNREPFLML